MKMLEFLLGIDKDGKNDKLEKQQRFNGWFEDIVKKSILR